MPPPTAVRPRRARATLLLLGALMAAASPGTAAAARLGEGEKALAFKSTDFLTGGALDLESDLGQKVILLDFGSIYCSSCMVTVPNLIKLRKKFPEEDLAIYNIYLDIYNPQRVVKFFRGFAKDIRIHLSIDEKLAVSREYAIDTLPTTVIIDRAGVIRRRIVGYTEADEKEIDVVIDKLVQELPVAAVSGAEARGEEGFTVYVPESFTKTLQDKIFVVGYLGGAGSKDVSLKLNNLPERTVTSKDNVFHFQSPLALAMNLIEIKGQVEAGKVQNQSLVLFRETRMGTEITSELPVYRFHREEEKKPCKKCHKMEVSLQDKSAMQQSEVCSGCHSGLAKRTYTHGPITVGGCLPCHDYQSFPNKYELRYTGAELCYGCHEAVKTTIQSRAMIHGPVAAGFCVVCHEPHGSSEKFLLARRADRLCIMCHQDFLREFSNPVIHRPVEDGDCTGCHDPHAAGQSKLLVAPRESLCFKCHDFKSMMHMHKIGVTAVTEFPPGTPLSAEGTTVCYTCHLFHGSSQAKLARGTKDECGRGCHDARRAQPDGE